MEPSWPSSAIPIDALISFHSQERLLFKRLVLGWEMKPIHAMAAISFWMWLESIGHPSFIQQMVAMSDEAIQCIAVEGANCVKAILIDAVNPQSAARRVVPTTTKVPGSPIDLGYLHNSWDSACSGVTSNLEDICPRIFVDLLVIASSKRKSHHALGVGDTSIIDVIGEGGNAIRAIHNMGVQNESSILGPFNGEISRWSLLNQSALPTKGGLVLMPSREDAAFGPYDEGASRGLGFSNPLQLYMKGNGAIGGYQEMSTPQSWNVPSNFLNMQQEIQSNHLKMLSQGFKMPFHPSSAELDMGRLSLSSNNASIAAGGVDQALVPDGNMGTAIKPLSSYSLMHQGSNLNHTTQYWFPVDPDERTLFITFSNGYPLEGSDLHEFFSRRYGGVEEIFIQDVEGDEQPLYARAVFYHQAFCLRVLAGNEKAKFMIKGRHVWARLYVPKRKRKAAQKARR